MLFSGFWSYRKRVIVWKEITSGSKLLRWCSLLLLLSLTAKKFSLEKKYAWDLIRYKLSKLFLKFDRTISHRSNTFRMMLFSAFFSYRKRVNVCKEIRSGSKLLECASYCFLWVFSATLSYRRRVFFREEIRVRSNTLRIILEYLFLFICVNQMALFRWEISWSIDIRDAYVKKLTSTLFLSSDRPF